MPGNIWTANDRDWRKRLTQLMAKFESWITYSLLKWTIYFGRVDISCNTNPTSIHLMTVVGKKEKHLFWMWCNLMEDGHVSQRAANQLIEKQIIKLTLNSSLHNTGLVNNTVGKSLRLTSKNSMAVILGHAWITSITTVFTCIDHAINYPMMYSESNDYAIL